MKELIPIEHNGQRVLTTLQLADSFGTDSQNISKNFVRNENRYQLGKHYYSLEDQSKRDFLNHVQIDDGLKNAKTVYLWTEKGAWLHAKSLNTDQAWEAYENLVDDYYTVKQEQIDISRLDPQMQMFHHMFQSVAKTQLQLEETQKQLTSVQSVVSTIQETFLQRDEDWRDMINGLMKGASFRRGGDYQELRNHSYANLEERARCDLNTRVRNLKQRLSESGATKTQINNANRMDVIENDPRLKEIYTMIVKELSIGTLVIA